MKKLLGFVLMGYCNSLAKLKTKMKKMLFPYKFQIDKNC
jgi:hypothetical protein